MVTDSVRETEDRLLGIMRDRLYVSVVSDVLDLSLIHI